MKFKLQPLERRWVLYDVGNSAFTLLVSTIMPIYFNSLAGADGLSEVSYLAYWGYATSIATLIVALCGPVLGTISDFPGWKKKLLPAPAWNCRISCRWQRRRHSRTPCAGWKVPARLPISVCLTR